MVPLRLFSIVMMDISSYTSIIKKMEELSVRAGDSDSTAYFRQLLRLLDSEPDKAIAELVSNRFWGGSGSFFDQEVYVKKRDVDTTAVSIEFKQLLLELLRLLRSEGHIHPWFDSRESLLEEGLEILSGRSDS